jgi:glycerophosphoryl diester phosphodiesterase
MRGLAGLLLIACAAVAAADPLVIAHRGASGYLTEHTLAAHAMAYAQGADYLEPDLVLSADGHPVVLHDLTLDAVSDVRTRFPGRFPPDHGRFGVITLEELIELAGG